jgi:L-threonylcarbamoyladenylate synthase
MIIKIEDNENSIKESLIKVANIIKSGGVVIFPTETLYGLGGKVRDEAVLKRIYKIKERSPLKPLPVMVHDIKQIYELSCHFPPSARLLAERYWPGPLTLILKCSSLPSLATCGKDSAGIRIPDYKIALDLLKYTGEPLAVTSANMSEGENLLTIEEIISAFKDKVDVILDAGEITYGVPSTIVDVTGEELKILREGKIPSEEIFKVVKREE